jgi:hypothetical protein
MAYFYFDFRDVNKQKRHDLLTSLVTQLSARSNRNCDVLSALYFKHDSGGQKPNEYELVQCLKKMISLPDQHPTYLIIDALDECSNMSGMPSPREQVLGFLKELVALSLPNLRICVTSRPEVDIRNALEPVSSRHLSLHDQGGQKKDIADYVTSVVHSDPEMARWREEDRESVIETVSERAEGM